MGPHPRKHGIDDTDDHTGVAGSTEDNIVVFDANGLPKDGGTDIQGAASSGQKTIPFCLVKDAGEPYVKTSQTVYQIVGHIIFPGTNNIGTPVSVKAIMLNTTTGTSYLRIFDYTNGNEIAVLSTASNSKVIVTDSTLSSLSTGEAIWEIQIKRDTAGENHLFGGEVRF